MDNRNKEITFDGFVRGLMVVAGAGVAFFVVRYLSEVLLPFFMAWLLAYLIYPMVTFFQYRCHLHFRILSIIVSLLVTAAVVAGLCALVIPPTLNEFASLRGEISHTIQEFGDSSIAQEMDRYFRRNFDETSLSQLVHNKDVVEIVRTCTVQLWSLLTQAFSLLKSLVGGMLILMYLFFILMDYERLSSGFVHLVPMRHRHTAGMILRDLQLGMQAYFRGQSLIALLVGILFSVGFSIVGMPLAVALGMFIGVLNLVPYLQMLGIVPAVLLALVRSNQTGENFWLIILYCFIVFLVVQGIQDLVLTPRIMGRMMGLRPAVILLSLSVWGYLLGFIGLIIALPLTTILISYYRFFVLKEERKGEKTGN